MYLIHPALFVVVGWCLILKDSINIRFDEAYYVSDIRVDNNI